MAPSPAASATAKLRVRTPAVLVLTGAAVARLLQTVSQWFKPACPHPSSVVANVQNSGSKLEGEESDARTLLAGILWMLASSDVCVSRPLGRQTSGRLPRGASKAPLRRG